MAKRVTPEMVDAFGALVRDRLGGDDPALRTAYVALFVSEVKVDQESIRISGSPQLPERAIRKTEPAVMGMVPGLAQKWCPTADKDGHSDYWRISINCR